METYHLAPAFKHLWMCLEKFRQRFILFTGNVHQFLWGQSTIEHELYGIVFYRHLVLWWQLLIAPRRFFLKSFLHYK